MTPRHDMERRASPAELGLDQMTVAIAAIVPTQEGQIVAVSDARISWGDNHPAADELVLKNRRIAFKWGVMFAATDVSAYQPAVTEIQGKLGYEGSKNREEFKADEVRELARSAYERVFEDRFFREHLARFGFANIAEFRRDGFNQMGKDLYHEYAYKLARFDLGLELLVYGFGEGGKPHIFEVLNPGKVIDHDIQQYAAIGSGCTMAYAALSRKKLIPGLEETIYRLLDAKFSSETASRVGRKTHVITMNRDGKVGMMRPEHINQVRAIWDKIMAQNEPADAVDVISKTDAVTALSDGSR
jgi:20S proteasome alpha/beta subunit